MDHSLILNMEDTFDELMSVYISEHHSAKAKDAQNPKVENIGVTKLRPYHAKKNGPSKLTRAVHRTVK